MKSKTKPHLRLVHSSAAKKRLWTTDYGMSQGHCASPKSAMKAACRYLIDNESRHCTIEGPDGAAARCYYNGFWGFTIVKTRGGKK